MTHIYWVVLHRGNDYLTESYLTQKSLEVGELFFYPTGEMARVIRELTHKEVNNETVLQRKRHF